MGAVMGEGIAGAPNAIEIEGVPAGQRGPSVRRALGMCFVPEERLGHGSVPDMSLWENAVLTANLRMNLGTFGFIGVLRAQGFAGRIVADFGVPTPGVDHAARSLSGGNLPKDI